MSHSQDAQPQEWTQEEREKLINAVSEYGADNWEKISNEIFAQGYSPMECAYQFIRLPISESLVLKLQSTYQKKQ